MGGTLLDLGMDVAMGDAAPGTSRDGAEEDDDLGDLGGGEDPLEAYGEGDLVDQTIGALEEIMMEEAVENIRVGFCRDNCRHFDAEEENKLIYMQLFKQYQTLLEREIETRLKAAIPGFDLQTFIQELSGREDMLDSDIFDLLLSFTDFATFKEIMLSHKMEEAGLGFEIAVTKAHIFQDEQEDGEPRPDLDDNLHIRQIEDMDDDDGADTVLSPTTQ